MNNIFDPYDMTVKMRMTKEDIRFMARKLRLVVVYQQYKVGNLTREDAMELLSGPICTGGPIVDDSRFIDSYEDILEFIKSDEATK